MSAKKMPLHIKIIIGLVLGIIWAFVSSTMGWNEFTINWIDPFGAIFIRLLKFIAVPLVLFSIISGVSGLSDLSRLGKMGLKTLVLYLVTTVTAVSLGLLLVNTITPGSYTDETQRVKNRMEYEVWVQETAGIEKPKDGKSYLTDPAYRDLAEAAANPEMIRQIQADRENMVSKQMQTAEASEEAGPLQFLVDMVPENLVLSISDNSLMLQVIFFAIFFGITLIMIPSEHSAPVIAFINGTNEVFLKMVDLVMKAAPFFVFALLAGVIAKMADTPAQVFEIFKGLGFYSLTVMIGLLFMIFIFYPLVITVFIKKLSYREFFKNISPAQFLAFSTSSSAATLPVTMECVEENMGVSKNVTSFVLPIGATVNMDGTSLYQAVAVIFLAQLHLVDLTLGQQLTIVLTATLASIGSAAVPSAGLVMLIIVLQSVGLNPAWIAIIFPVDRILDMFRTVVNVTGDATVSTLIASSEGELTKYN
ncbi:dicarboxylate/amino acid:cation symporter [Fulvivirga sedimenti]|uniref:Dicarboxylate/amino acid:cation symporter n=1 Tax=Fulvivirga sedimenti TaxID=2879465 RepID=A0A9X1L2I8_9BACT|nr:dicarboxylate/amino acid:cation symporter [Fulvivirga sedimenti]MCA6078241.1 dicarboxylate/amino acid:cation symporter [Fulvivirga sedimenti]